MRAFFFLYFGATGIVLPFLAPYLRGLGLSGRQIAVGLSVAPLLGLFMPLAWAWLADRTGRHVGVLRALCLGLLAGAMLLLTAERYLPILASLAVMAVFSSGALPLADAMAAAATARSGSYGRTRLWGSLGFIVTSAGGGVWLERRGNTLGDATVPALLVGAYALAAVASLWVRRAPVVGERPRLRDMKQLFSDPRLRLLLAVGGLHWASGTPYNLLFGILVRDQGLPATVVGSAFALGVIVEVGVLHQFSALTRRFSRERLLGIALAATAVRWFAVAHAEAVWSLIALQSLHGLSFGLFWAATMALLGDYVPSTLRASGQALLTIALAAGNLGGYYVAGALYDAGGNAAIAFSAAGVLELVPLALMLRFRKVRALGPAV